MQENHCDASGIGSGKASFNRKGGAYAPNCDEHGALHDIWVRAAFALLVRRCRIRVLYTQPHLDARKCWSYFAATSTLWSKPKLTDNAVFGSPCTAIRTPKRKTLDRHGEALLIIGKRDQN